MNTLSLPFSLSQVVKRTTSPDWNETFKFDAILRSSNLVLRVLDHDKGKDDSLGFLQIPLRYLPVEVPHQSWFEIQDGKGSIYLKVFAFVRRERSHWPSESLLRCGLLFRHLTLILPLDRPWTAPRS